MGETMQNVEVQIILNTQMPVETQTCFSIDHNFKRDI